jgi:oxygen-independent coproporphyrinogen-3 oxidase
MEPEHLSLYALTIEHGTPLQRRWARGLIPLIDDDLAADMYEHAMDRLPQAGFEQYEISNWARRAGDGSLLACRHNMQYWLNRSYLGFGAGAHGCAAGFRTMNVGGIRPYIARCQAAAPATFPAGPATRRVIPVDRRVEMQETMLVGLRLTGEGVSAAGFQARFGRPLEEVFSGEIERLHRLGLLEWLPGADPRLRLTRQGRLLGNQVFMQFVG